MLRKKIAIFFVSSFFMVSHAFAWNLFKSKADAIKDELEELCLKIDEQYELLDMELHTLRVIMRHELFATLNKIYKYETKFYKLCVQGVKENRRLERSGSTERIDYPLQRKRRDLKNLEAIKSVPNFKIPQPALLDALIKIVKNEVEETRHHEEGMPTGEHVVMGIPIAYDYVPAEFYEVREADRARLAVSKAIPVATIVDY